MCHSMKCALLTRRAQRKDNFRGHKYAPTPRFPGETHKFMFAPYADAPMLLSHGIKLPTGFLKPKRIKKVHWLIATSRKRNCIIKIFH